MTNRCVGVAEIADRCAQEFIENPQGDSSFSTDSQVVCIKV